MLSAVTKMFQKHGMLPVEKDFGGKWQEMPLLNALFSGQYNSIVSQHTYNEIYEKLWMVYACIDEVAKNLSRLPIKVYQRTADGSKVEVTHYPEFYIFKSPNKDQTRSDFHYESITRLLLQGEMYWELTRHTDGKVVAMYADWQKDQVEVLGSENELITGFRRTVSGKPQFFKPEDVLYLKEFNASNNRRGMSKLRPIRDIIALDLAATEYNKQFFKGGMNFPGVFTTDQVLNETDARRLHEELQDYYGGLRQMHAPPVLWGGLKFDKTSDVKLKDVEFADLRRHNIEDIAGGFGVPPELIGIGNRTYENLQQAQEWFWENTLIPLSERIAEGLTKALLPRLTNRNELFIRHDYSEVQPLIRRRRQMLKDYETGVKLGVLARNEMRIDVYGKEPFDDEEMDVPNPQKSPISAAVASDSNDPKSVKLIEARQTQPKALSEGTQDAEVVTEVTEYRYTKVQRDAMWKSLAEETETLESDFGKIMLDIFARQAEAVKERIESLNSDKEVHSEPDVMDIAAWTEEIEQATTPFLAAIVLAKINEWGDEAIESLPANVLSKLGERVRLFSQFINETTNDLIQKQIAEFIENELQSGAFAGEQISELSNRIQKEVFGTRITRQRANLISRTEVVGATNFGTQEALRLARIPLKVWLTSRDNKVRDSHRIDGTAIPIDQNFTLLDGRTVPYPMDFNERCFLTGAAA